VDIRKLLYNDETNNLRGDDSTTPMTLKSHGVILGEQYRLDDGNRSQRSTSEPPAHRQGDDGRHANRQPNESARRDEFERRKHAEDEQRGDDPHPPESLR
jgi:hypothetical protein